MRASSIMGQQEALCVQSCQYDLQVASDVCEGISNDLKELTNAVSELAWAMKSVRDTYQGIAQEAQDCGLLVNGDTVSLYDESDDYLGSKFNELQAQAEVQRLNYERAEHVFSLALDSLKVDTYEQLIEPVFNALKDQFVLDDEHPYANALPYGMGLIDIGGNSVAATTMMRYRGLYASPRILRQRRPASLDIPPNGDTSHRTSWNTNDSSDSLKGWKGSRRSGGGCRRRYHRL